MKYAVKTALATSWTSSKDIVIPSNGSSNPFAKTSHLFERLTGAIRFKAIVNFSNRSSQSVEKTQDVIRAKKKENHQPFELVQSVPKNIIQPSA